MTPRHGRRATDGMAFITVTTKLIVALTALIAAVSGGVAVVVAQLRFSR